MLMYEPAANAAPASATSVSSENFVAPGRMMINTPTNPATTAVQRRRRTTSPSISTAPIVTNSGVE